VPNSRFQPGRLLSLDHKIPPPVVSALVAAAMWGVSALGPQLPLASVAKYVVLVVLCVVGIAFDVLGLLAFRRSRTTVNPLKPERASSMVTDGVYRVTRNPMYLGMAVLLLAWAVYLSALLPLAGPMVFVLYITRFQIKPEERALKGIFGEEYVSYASRVRRWL
jgi:protein-S-isoprenylcysteine O-methyltransferase Ste14